MKEAFYIVYDWMKKVNKKVKKKEKINEKNKEEKNDLKIIIYN